MDSNSNLDPISQASDPVPSLERLWRYGNDTAGWVYGSTPGPLDAENRQVSCPDCGSWVRGSNVNRALASVERHRKGAECETLWRIRAALWAGCVPLDTAGVPSGFPFSACTNPVRWSLGVRVAPGAYYPGSKGRRAHSSDRVWMRLDAMLALVDLRETLQAKRWTDVVERIELWQEPERLERVNARLRRIELARGLSEPLVRAMARQRWASASDVARAVNAALGETK